MTVIKQQITNVISDCVLLICSHLLTDCGLSHVTTVPGVCNNNHDLYKILLISTLFNNN